MRYKANSNDYCNAFNSIKVFGPIWLVFLRNSLIQFKGFDPDEMLSITHALFALFILKYAFHFSRTNKIYQIGTKFEILFWSGRTSQFTMTSFNWKLDQNGAILSQLFHLYSTSHSYTCNSVRLSIAYLHLHWKCSALYWLQWYRFTKQLFWFPVSSVVIATLFPIFKGKFSNSNGDR